LQFYINAAKRNFKNSELIVDNSFQNISKGRSLAPFQVFKKQLLRTLLSLPPNKAILRMILDKKDSSIRNCLFYLESEKG
jgi:hypothetical protein